MATSEQQGGLHKQSRLGKRPVPIPQGVQVTISGQEISAKGPKGEMTQRITDAVEVQQKDGTLQVVPKAKLGQKALQFQGLTRTLLRNMLEGVSKGYHKSLDLVGVGYRAELKGDKLTIAAGMSHTVTVTVPKTVTCKIEIVDDGGQKRPRVHLDSYDKEVLGQLAARLRSLRPPEPYKGKGIRYTGERVREKAGKAGAKGKG